MQNLVKPYRWVTPDTRLAHTKAATRRAQEQKKRLDDRDNQRSQETQRQMQSELRRKAAFDQRDTDRQNDTQTQMNIELRRKAALDDRDRQPAPRPSVMPPGVTEDEVARRVRASRERDAGPGLLERGAERVEQFQKRFMDPLAAGALQVAESPVGAALPGMESLRTVRPPEVAREIVPHVEPKSFRELKERGAVNPLLAAFGSEKEQEKAAAVLEEAGLGTALLFQVSTDLTNLLPVAGFTKVDDFVRLVRAGTRLTGRARSVALQNPKLQRFVKAIEAEAGAAPLGGKPPVDVEGGFPARFKGQRRNLEGGPPPRPPKPLAAEGPELPGWQGVTDRIATKLNEGVEVFGETKLARTSDMRRRTAAALKEARELRAQGVDPDEIFQRTMKHYEGTRPDLLFDEPLAINADELVELGNRSWEYALEETGNYHTARRALKALKTMVEDRRVPRPHEDKAIRAVYGDALADSLANIRRAPKGWADWAFETAVMPKSILSSFDISFPARQGFWTWGTHPVAFADSMRVSAKIWKDPKFADELLERLVNETTLEVGGAQKLVPVSHPRAGVVETPLGEIFEDVGILPHRVEPFLSPLAEKIPGVGRSAVSFTTAGNKLRTDVFRFWVRKWMSNGTELTPERLQKLGDLVNALTGRATFVKGDPWKILQAAWWSPQYRLSFPQAVATAFRNLPGIPGADPAIARVAFQELVTTFTGTVGILAMLKASGAADVNLDPRSSDFGKARIGPQRINFFGTSQLLARSIAQMVKGQRLDPELGVVPTDPGGVAQRYFRSGLAPEWGALWDFIEGESFLGETLRPSVERGVTGSEIIKREAFNRMVPMAWRDVVEAIKEDGVRGAFIAPLGFVGVSVQAYEPRAAQELQNIPEFTGGITSREISDIRDFWRHVDEIRDEWRAEGQPVDDLSWADSIRYIGEQEGKDPEWLEWAVGLRSKKNQDRLRNPEWIRFVVEHADEIRKDKPDLLRRNDIIDAIREEKELVR